jgi:hypothetical protein
MLRKKAYDFSAADKIVDNIFKIRDAESKAGAANLEPPEIKKIKLEAVSGETHSFYVIFR